MTTMHFFETFLSDVKQTPAWKTLEQTVEDSPWHREANVAVHTLMTLDAYFLRFASDRNKREQLLTFMALLFHDFGKPEAEETLEKKDQPGVFYRRYAGHEPISGNEFISFMCDHPQLRENFFDEGGDWDDLRTIKFMIEHHLPYGLKNPTKRADLRQAVAHTLQGCENAFWDMLRSDAAGRISDDHETKLRNVDEWIEEFKLVPVKPKRTAAPWQKVMHVLVGVSGAGKSTWVKRQQENWSLNVASEDDWRLEYAGLFMDTTDLAAMDTMTKAEQYDACWKFCHLTPGSGYDAFAKARFEQLLSEGRDLVLDRMNQSKKGRSKWIQAAKQAGYWIHSVEFPISESVAKSRQRTRGDKALPDYRVHQLIMQLETPWLGPEVDTFEVVSPP